VPEFLVEAYVSRTDVQVEPQRFDEASPAVRFVRSIFVPEDETCFYLFQARSIDAVRDAVSRVGLRVERITEARSAG
jgi:hypothetical protein